MCPACVAYSKFSLRMFQQSSTVENSSLASATCMCRRRTEAQIPASLGPCNTYEPDNLQAKPGEPFHTVHDRAKTGPTDLAQFERGFCCGKSC